MLRFVRGRYGPPLTLLAKGNGIVAVGLMVILAASSAVLAPILLRLLLPIVTGDHNLQFNVFKMVSTLGVSQFLPLCAGLVVSQIRPRLAERLKRPAGRLCGLLNLVLLGMILAVQFPMLVQIRLVGYFGMLVLVTLALLAGWLLAAPGASNRKTLAVTTAVRNVGVARLSCQAVSPVLRLSRQRQRMHCSKPSSLHLLPWCGAGFHRRRIRCAASKADLGSMSFFEKSYFPKRVTSNESK